MSPPLLALPALSLAQMETLARRLAPGLRAGDTITLTGDVGAGKTAFARALIGALATKPVEVTSPTFALSQSYDITLADGAKETLWHLDLYRLEEAREAEVLGLRELWDHVVIIEWPAIIAHLLPPERLDIVLGFASEAARSLHFHGNEAWRRRLESLR